jgi:hypothetical protein
MSHGEMNIYHIIQTSPHETAKSVQTLRYGIDNREIWARFLAEARDFSLLHRVQIDSYTVGTRGCLHIAKRQCSEADNSPLCSAEIKNAWRYTSIPK